MDQFAWQKCLDHLRDVIPADQFAMWIQPLQFIITENELKLFAPNKFVLDWVSTNYLAKIGASLAEICGYVPRIVLSIGSSQQDLATETKPLQINYLNSELTFDKFIIGNSNQLGCAAAKQVAENPGKAYNPLFIYGGVGLGKTHLMHAIGNSVLNNDNKKRISYLHAEKFVTDMIKALQRGTIDDFKHNYRSLNVLLIDDIQFFAGKDRSQEEFFHTLNTLLDGQQQVVLTCDRYPKAVDGVEERLKSRFGWGLTVAIEPPELETRVAILMSKAEQSGVVLPYEVAFFIAKRIQSNVRELEGSLKRIIANAHFKGVDITLDFARESLKDLLALQAKLVSIDNIQETVAKYYKIKTSELLAKNRHRSLARARQVAMALAKELTSHSLPEIGAAFGGRDHTTVLHACRKVKELLDEYPNIEEDYRILIRILST